MSLGFAVAAAKIGTPIARFLLKNYLGEAAAAAGAGLVDIAAQRISDEEGQRLCDRQFEDIGDKIVRRLLPLFEDIEIGAAEAIAHEIGLTLAGHVSAEFFLERDLEPAKLGTALRAARPLPRNMFSQAEIALYERALDEAIRYAVAIAQSLPKFEAQAAAATLGRLSRIGGDLEKVLDGISRIERLVQTTDISETTRRYEADYRQAVQRNLDYLELFGADISPEAQRHSLSVGYVSLDLTSTSSGRAASATHSATALLWLLANRRGRILIRGHAGSGKSTLLRWLAMEAASGRHVSSPGTQFFISFSGHGKGDFFEARSTGDRREIVFLDDHPEILSPKISFNAWKSFISTSNLRNKISKTERNPDVFVLDDLNIATGDEWAKLLEQSLSISIMSRIPFLIRLRDCINGRLPTPDDLPYS
jgi:hypothetical protein